MKNNALDKIFSSLEIHKQAQKWKEHGEKIVFTNGCFDILHQGHLDILNFAADKGDRLIVGVNSDASVKRLKGPSRPINNEAFRSEMLASLIMVDAVVIFDEDTPLKLIEDIVPDVIVKGGDYKEDEVVGGEIVTKNGGSIEIFPILDSYSTTSTIKKIQRDADKID